MKPAHVLASLALYGGLLFAGLMCAGPLFAGPAVAAHDAHATEDAISKRAQRNYTQFCSGCHLSDGSGSPSKGIPSMHHMLERFLSVPGGREFIVQVPGVMNSGLNDEEVAQLMNWLVPRVSSNPAIAPGYTAPEIAALRQSRPTNVPAVRWTLIDRLEKQAPHYTP